MTKTLNFELSKRLTEWWYLDNIETEYHYTVCWLWKKIKSWKLEYTEDIKTLTLEEAIDFLPEYICEDCYELIIKKKEIFYINRFKPNNCYEVITMDRYLPARFKWETLFEAIEKMIEYLLNNNLLTK